MLKTTRRHREYAERTLTKRERYANLLQHIRDDNASDKLYPVVMPVVLVADCGRFRVLYPHSFAPKGDSPCCGTTICRLNGGGESPVVICNEQHRFIVVLTAPPQPG